ncbi:MAG: LysR substrate-binding domain-containing protein [Xanthobacteraceae bacterium]
MDLIGTLGVLVRVVETGSFSAVSRERGLSQAAVARQISQLEQHFGVRLLHRTTRKLSLTEDGDILLGHARIVLDGVDTMETELGRQRSSPVGLVRVGLPVAASPYIAPRVSGLLTNYPGLKIDLVVHDRFGDMIEDRLDLAIRPGEITDASLVVRSAGTSIPVVVAAPGYLKQYGAPCIPDELVNHRCLVHNTGQDSNLWEFGAAEGTQSIRIAGGFSANDTSAVHLAARSGCGIALLPMIEVFDDLRRGDLVRILSDFSLQGVPISIVYPSRRHLAPRTRLVMEFILEGIKQLRSTLAAVES